MPAPNCRLLFYLFLLLSDIIQNSINSMHGSYHMWVGEVRKACATPNKQTTSHTAVPLAHPISGARHTVHKT